MSDQDKSRDWSLRQLAGPGAPGIMVNDTPLWHFDILEEDIQALVSNPVEFLKGVGFEGIDEKHEVSFIRGEGQARSGGWCCYKVGDKTICHYHAQ